MRDLDEGMSILDHLRLEHRRINELVCAIEHQLVQCREPPASPGVSATVPQNLETLRQLLAQHFQKEEVDGYMEEALVRLPRLGEEGIALRDEHAELLAELDSLRGLLANHAAEIICEPFKIFARHLLNHEARENRALAEAFGTDFADEALHCPKQESPPGDQP